MRKNLFVCVTLILLFSLVNGCSKRPDEFASVMFFMGDVLCNGNAIEIGASLKQDDVIKTSELSFCDIKLGGSLVRIKEKSTLTLSTLMKSADAENVGLELSLGKMLCKPKKLLHSEQFTVKTPTAIAGVRGTSFTVEADARKTTRIKVFDGNVNVGRRIKHFEEYPEEVVKNSSLVEQGHKVIITESDLEKAERNVEKFMNAQKDETAESYVLFVSANHNHIKIGQKDILKFSSDDFQKDNTELIAIEEKPAEIVARIVKAIKEEPKTTYGALLVTRYEIYYIKDGKIAWEGKVRTAPIKSNGKLYILSDENIFCASEAGPVFWRKNILDAQKLELTGNILRVTTSRGKEELDMETGEIK